MSAVLKGTAEGARPAGASSVGTVTVELEVRDWGDGRATAKHLAPVFTLCREDVSAQVPSVILGERRGQRWEDVSTGPGERPRNGSAARAAIVRWL